MKRIEEELISIHTVTNFAQIKNVITKTVITHIIKSSKFITPTVTSQNSVRPTKTKILDVTSSNSVPSLILKLKSKYK